MMLEMVATNVAASQLPKRWPSETPAACAKMFF